MKIKYICKLCNKEFDGTRNFTGHLKVHKISSREYYDKFLKKPDDGICQVCGSPTVFFKFANGYRKTCSDKCHSLLGVKKVYIDCVSIYKKFKSKVVGRIRNSEFKCKSSGCYTFYDDGTKVKYK